MCCEPRRTTTKFHLHKSSIRFETTRVRQHLPSLCHLQGLSSRHGQTSAVRSADDPVAVADRRMPRLGCDRRLGRGALRFVLPASRSLEDAARLNSRPRKTLDFATPDEVFAGLVDKAANAVTSR